MSKLTEWNYQLGKAVKPCCMVCEDKGDQGNESSCPPGYLAVTEVVTLNGLNCICYTGQCSPPFDCPVGNHLDGLITDPTCSGDCGCGPGDTCWYLNLDDGTHCQVCSGGDYSSLGYSKFAYSEAGWCDGNKPVWIEPCGCSCTPREMPTPPKNCTTSEKLDPADQCNGPSCLCQSDDRSAPYGTPATIYCCNHQDNETDPCYKACLGYTNLDNECNEIIPP